MCKQFLLVSAAILLTASAALQAQQKSVNPGINDAFQKPDVDAFVARFEKEGRDAYDHREQIVKACKLKPGLAVADIGAGTGLFTRLFAAQVGDKGRVYAVDIAENFVRHIEQSARQQGLKQITGVVCSADSTRLPEASIDLAFICDTYHHFEFPHKTMRSIHQALKPGGQVILIDFHRIEGVSREWTLGHVRAGQEVFTREIEAAGFRQIEQQKDLLRESYFVRFEKVSDGEIGKPERGKPADGEHGVLRHKVRSHFQAGETEIRVLLPDGLAERAEAGGAKTERRCPVIYVLPVEPHGATRYGDGLDEVRRLDLHNKHQVIFVAPSFSTWPWYADHPQDAGIQQETYFVDVVVPFIDRTYPVQAEAGGRLLLGFSKSGWGAWSLLLRHRNLFGRAAAWDAPLMMHESGKYGSGAVFGTQENFNHYRITDLLRSQAEALRGPADRHAGARLILTGYGNFRKDHQQIHDLLVSLDVPHVYRDGPSRKHDWHSGWVAEAVDLLLSKP